MMFTELWPHQKSLKIDSSWFESKRKIAADMKAIQQIELVRQ